MSILSSKSVKAIALVGVAATVAVPAMSQMKPSSPQAVASAAMDCWAATGAGPVDEAKLQQLGWQPGSMKSPDGKAVDTLLRFYGKSGSNVILMLADSPKTLSSCTVMSRVAKVDDIGATAQLLLTKLSAADPGVKGARKDHSIVYISGLHMAMLEPTGTKEKPSTRIVVANTSAEKK